ncbi:Hypothetical predicted protein [Paramuricea clavata]|uniref:Uncharacterized protein n=1 Tax=Paramuricea clavata TaxID=317549 RepID=A0A6S7GGK3_PARCT|nr:Hypothetical predicted protein [Paramuricea clavata]
MNRTAELMPNFRRMNRTEITGDRTRHVLTFNPNSAKPGEEIYVNIPKLKADSVLVPDNMALVFDFKNSNTKSWFRNNLGKLLQKGLEIRLTGEKVYDNSGESLLEVYKDLWLHNKQRDDMVEDAIASEATRKKISKDNAANDDAEAIVRCIRNETKNQDQQDPQRPQTLCPTQHGKRPTICDHPTHSGRNHERPRQRKCGRIHPGEHRTGIRVHRQHRSRKEIRGSVRIRTRAYPSNMLP